MNIHKKSLQDEKRIKRWSICCWVSAGISWFIQQKYIQWIYQNLKYTKLGREFGIVFVFIVVFPCLLNLFLWPSQYYSEKELRENIPPIMIYQESNELKKSLKFWYRLPGHYHGSENYSVFTPRLEIINYYMEELRKYGWEFIAEEDNVEKFNGKKVEEKYIFRNGTYELQLSFPVETTVNFEGVVYEKSYYIMVFPIDR